jgi:tetratricopeptide (TPR) repeat protein
MQIVNLYHQGHISIEQYVDILKQFADQNLKQALSLLSAMFNMMGNQRQENVNLFKKNPFYWFLPFYDQAQFKKKLLEDGKNVSYKDLYHSISQIPFIFSDSYKYQALVTNLTMPEWIIEKNIEVFAFVTKFMEQDGISTNSMQYFAMLMDLWTFQKYFPDADFQKMIHFDEALRQNTWLEMMAEKSSYHKFLMQRSLMQQDYEAYTTSATKYLAINSQDYEAWNNLGIVYKNQQDYAQAIDAYRKAIEIKPDDDAAWNNLGNAYVYLKDYAQAIDAYRKVIEIKPDDDAAWYNLGIAYQNQQDYAQTIDAYRKAIEIKPDDVAAWYNLGIAYDD